MPKANFDSQNRKLRKSVIEIGGERYFRRPVPHRRYRWRLPKPFPAWMMERPGRAATAD